MKIFKLLFAILVNLFITSNLWSQSVGDYRTNATGTWSWTTTANWQRCEISGTWAGATSTTYPGQNTGTGTVTINNNTNVTLNISPANEIGALIVGQGTSGSLVIGNSTTVRTLTIDGDFTVASNANVTINNNTVTHELLIGGNLTVNGTLDLRLDNNTFCNATFNGSSQTISGTGTIEFYNVTHTAGTLTLARNISINSGNLTLSGGTFDLSIFTANRTANGGTIGIAAGATLRVAGTNSLPVNYANYNFNTTSTVEYYGTNQTVNAVTYGNLIIASSDTKTLQGNITVNNNLSITGSSVLASDIYQITGNATGQLSMAPGTGLTIGNTTNGTVGTAITIAFPLNYTSANINLDNNSTVTYQQNANQIISAIPEYGNLVASASGNKTASAPLTISGDVTVNAGSILNLGTVAGTSTIAGNADINGTLTFGGTNAKTLTISGNLSGTGTLIMPTLAHTLNLNGETNAIGTFNNSAGVLSTVNYTRSGNQTVFGSANYRNLTFSGSGVKTLQGPNTTVNNTLTFSGGTFDIGAYDLTLPPTATINGASQANGYIIAGGNGYFYRSGTIAGHFQITYPVGSSDYYSHLTISAIAGTLNGSLGVKTLSASGANSLAKIWEVTTTGLTLTSATATFTYNEAEVNGDEGSYNVWHLGNSGWENPATASINTTTNEISTGSTGSFTGYWTAGVTAPAITWYSYLSGDWDNWETWTLDPSGTTRINSSNSIPGSIDKVVILNGRNVNLATNNKTITFLNIEAGGVLDIGNTTGHSFGNVIGQGRLRLNTGTFPDGTFTDFVSPTGGTVEYYDISGIGISNVQYTYNNLIISNYSASDNTVFIDNNTNPTNYLINGYFSLENHAAGNLTINFGNSSPSSNLINMTIYGNVEVGAGCTIGVNRFASALTYPNPNSGGIPTDFPVHKLYLYGNLTNNGTVRFTGLPDPWNNAYYTQTNTTYGGINYGEVQVTFRGATNNTINCNGRTDFFRLIVEKGTDQTYILEVNSTNTANFTLYGPNNQGGGINQGGPEGFGWGTYSKALFIHYGTLKLNENITIPSLSQGGEDINIIPTAQLWINGASVSTTLNSGDPYYKATTVYGKLRISSGSLTTAHSTGLVLGVLGTPELLIEGGSLSLCQFWAITGTNIVSYIQTGGTVDVRMQGQNQVTAAMFNLSNTNSVFKMSGGAINFTDNQYVAGYNGSYFYSLMDIQAQEGNYQVTGGTVNLNLPSSTTPYTANSTVPFYNMNITRRTGTGTVTLQWETPASNLTILNDLTLGANTALNLQTNTIDLNIGRNFTIGAGSVYTPGNNTTTFNGALAQNFTNSGTITDGLNNLSLVNSGTDLTLDGTNTTLTVNGTLTLDDGTILRDNGKTVYAYGNIVNSGTHYRPASGAGSIQLTGTAAQTISGDGSGIFNNLTLNKSGGSATLLAGTTITGNLRLAGSASAANPTRLNIGPHNLLIETTGAIYTGLTGTATSFNQNCMVLTGGLTSDGGITRHYDSNNEFTFPFGIYTNSTYYYMPAKIGFTASPTSYGTITSRPVSGRHPLTATTDALLCYWNTTSSGFIGIPATAVTHKYYHDAAGLSNYFINGGIETDFIPAVYRGGSAWEVINLPGNVDEGTNEVLYNNTYTADGDYTAGDDAAFTGTIDILYSVASGNWNDPLTWSTTRVGTPGDGGTPASTTIVYVCDGFEVTTSADGAVSGKVFIEKGAILDLSTHIGHSFTIGFGQGTLQIGSGYFPSGDWGSFLQGGGGTVEYYNSGSNIVIPATSATTGYTLNHYNNLILSQNGAYTITLPASNLEIYSHLVLNGSGTGMSRTNNAAIRTIVVDSSLTQNSGIFEIRNGFAQTFQVNGNVNINGTFGVANTGTVVNHKFEIYGNLVNNGTITLTQGANGHVATIFKSSTNTSISGTGTNTFYSLEVDKGADAIPVLTVQSPLTTAFDPSLTLTNGTFRWDNSGTFNASVNSAVTIPASACLSVNLGTLNVVNYSAANSNGLLLQGKLEVLGGTMNIGKTAAATYHNDIEYAASGTPSIVINNGVLNVYGQIRRTTSNVLGSLQYAQTGGTVNIYGQNADATQLTRAKLEICNSNSSFTMAAGTINLFRGSGSTYGDLYLRPENYNVTGGTIVIGQGSVVSSPQSYTLDASCNLHNLTIAGTATYSADATLSVNPLVLSGNLDIYSNSTLSSGAQKVNVSIAGDFTNNGTYTPNSNITSFNGSGAQVATFGSATDFYDLVIDKPAGIITLAGTAQPSVDNDLTINSGTLNDGNRTLLVYGNVTNNAIHTSTSGNITLAGAAAQNITGDGDGQFGNLIINNTSGIVNMTADATINGVLTFTSGYLNIYDYLLTLGVNASIGGSTTTDRCIITSGVLSDAGVRKVFPSGTSASFTFPVGVAGKYTPVYYSLNYATPGSITVKPVNAVIPSVYNTATDELQYYWNITSSGFAGISDVVHKYSYIESDVLGYAETASDFVGARYFGLDWYNLGHSAINTVDHSINITGADYIDGEYTCGWTNNFNDKPIYYSRIGATNIATGADWNSTDTWTEDSDHDGPAVSVAPNGNPMVIRNGHVVQMTSDNQRAYSVEIHGELNVQTYTGHSLGFVTGDGRLTVQNSTAGQFVFPGGIFTSFMNTTGSTVEYEGITASVATDILPTIKVYQNLDLTGTQEKYLPNVDITIKGNLLISDSRLLNNTYNRNITLWGNWTDNVATGGFVPGTGQVIFAGTTASELNSSVAESFYNLRINKTAANLQLYDPITVSNTLTLTSGNIITDNTNILTLTSVSTTAASGGSSSSFVDGPLRKNISSGSTFTFPIGDGSRYGRLVLPSVTSASSPAYWVAAYVNSDPDAINTSATLTSPLTSISDNEYWIVTRPASGTNTANIRLRWDDVSYPGITGNATARNYLRVVEYDGTSAWTIRGETVNASAQTVSTTTQVTNENYIFTIGVAGITASLTAASVSNICNNGATTSVPVTLTGTPNWTLTYRVTNVSTGNFIDFTESDITSSSFGISLQGSDLTSIANSNATTNYIITLLSVADNSGSSGICSGSTTLTILRTNIPDITGTFTVGVNELRTYSTANNAGDAYAWSWSGTSGGSIASAGSYTTSITMTGTPGTYTLVMTETTAVTNCVATDQQPIEVTSIPSPEIMPDDDPNVCAGESVIYYTEAVTGHTYDWTVSGGTYTGTGNSITVTWGSGGAGTVSVTEWNTAHTVSGSDANNYFVSNAIITTYTLTAASATVCSGSSTTITLSNSQTGVTYELRDDANDAVIGSPVAGNNGSTLTFTTDARIVSASTPVTYYVYAYNSGCVAEITDQESITFVPLPTVTISEAGGNTILCEEVTTTLTATPSPAGTYSYSWEWTWVTDGTTPHTETGSSTTSTQTITTPGLVPTSQIYPNNSTLVTYSVTATDSNNCSGSDTYDITVYRKPNTGPQHHINNLWND